MNFEEYKDLYNQSISNPDEFWLSQAKQRLIWDKEPLQAGEYSFKKPVNIKWFEDGQMNICYNAVDRHASATPDKTAIIWEGDSPDVDAKVSYAELKDEVSKFANALKELGVKKGNVVTIYMPMILESAYAMLACARIGAVHSVVFGGFSPESLKDRVIDCDSKLIITADEGRRGGKKVPLMANALDAVKGLGDVDILCIENTGELTQICHSRAGGNLIRDLREIPDQVGDDKSYNIFSYDSVKQTVSSDCDCEVMDSEDPLFILYTSGSTGKPKGVLHSTAGYALYTSLTHETVFNIQSDSIYWCTADIGWITGHSYIIYGPLINGATSVMFEGVPTYPDASRCWDVVDKHKITEFYTAPTAIRALMAAGDEFVTKSSRESIRVLGTVGEPINPEAWRWYNEIVGQSRCDIVDTYWQTETGGFLITPLAGATPLDGKGGSATLPFFGIKPVIVDNEGNELEGEAEGNLCISASWPSQMRSVYKDHARFEDTYFSQFAGYYFTGDGARRDADGYYWITGRVDDVLNVSGHRLGTAEVESALVLHEAVAEAAVVGFPHDIKGQGIYCYVRLMGGVGRSEELRAELVAQVRKEIGAIAKPDVIKFTRDLPKTRSGKIMRRILRKIAEGERDINNLGNISTLLNPDIVQELIEAASEKEVMAS